MIFALIFVLGLLIGVFLTAGGRRKWKTRYHDEVSRRETLERTHKQQEADWVAREKDREAQFATREKEWREQDSLRGAAVKSRSRGAAAAPIVDPVVDPVNPEVGRLTATPTATACATTSTAARPTTAGLEGPSPRSSRNPRRRGPRRGTAAAG